VFWRLLVLLAARSRDGFRWLREWNRRGGAGGTGLAALVETHALQAIGDAAVTVTLAGSLFFSVPTHAARSRIALYLVITMAPFAVIAPVLGPLLDRLRHGRRLALAATMIARAVLALVISHALSAHHAFTLYPAALGLLVAGKAYGVARSAAVPRLVPEGMTLVQANSRLTLAGVAAPAIGGGVGIAVLKVLGHGPELILAAAIYCVGAFWALRLPRQADGGRGSAPRTTGRLRLPAIGGDVRSALWAAATLRWLSGFLLLFGAFVVKDHPIGGLSTNLSLGVLAVGIGAGNLLGTTVGPRTASVAARRLSIVLVAATTALAVFAALNFGLLTFFLVVSIGAAAAAVSKLALDATIQRRVDEVVQTATFARSETTLQLAWVVGAGIGIALPTQPTAGFLVAAAVLGASVLTSFGDRGFSRRDVAPSSAGPDPAR
jgi:MFS family permease